MTKSIRMMSWNVNGIRAILKKNFYECIQTYNPDVICLQETKTGSDPVAVDLPAYEMHWNGAKKMGYSGTAVFTRFKPLSVMHGIGHEDHDQEGRVLSLEFKDVYLVNVYTPNAQPNLKRLHYRQKWEAEFLSFLKNLERKKPVIVCGDLNVAHQEIDLARPKENVGNPGFTNEERECFEKLMQAGFLDSFREFHTEGGHYTWWSYRTNARARNIGWRIDYFLISKILRSKLNDAKILSDVLGSDHCPVLAEFDAEILE